MNEKHRAEMERLDREQQAARRMTDAACKRADRHLHRLELLIELLRREESRPSITIRF